MSQALWLALLTFVSIWFGMQIERGIERRRRAREVEEGRRVAVASAILAKFAKFALNQSGFWRTR